MYRRGKKGILYISVHGVRQSSKTNDKERAKRLEHKLNAEAWDREQGLVIPDWDGACLLWTKRNPLIAASEKNLRFATWWRPLLTRKNLRRIDTEMMNELILKHRPKVSETERRPQNATANAYVAFVQRIITETSSLRPKFITYPEQQGRMRWLTPAEWFLLAGTASDDVRDICEFALSTGLREANCMFFDWTWVKDTWALIPPEFTKTSAPYGIPLNRTAQAVIARRRTAAIRHPNLVFLNQGKPWYRVSIGRAMRDAVEAAGIDAVTFHGFRHTFASWLAQKGISEVIRARLGCWKTGSMADHYAHFDVESLRPFSEVIDSILSDSSQASTLATGSAA